MTFVLINSDFRYALVSLHGINYNWPAGQLALFSFCGQADLTGTTRGSYNLAVDQAISCRVFAAEA